MGHGHTERQAAEPRTQAQCPEHTTHTPISHGWPLPIALLFLLLGHEASHTGQQPHIPSVVCVMSCGQLPVLCSSCLLLSSLWCSSQCSLPLLPLLLPTCAPCRACLGLLGGGCTGEIGRLSRVGACGDRGVGRRGCTGGRVKRDAEKGEWWQWGPASGRTGVGREGSL